MVTEGFIDPRALDGSLRALRARIDATPLQDAFHATLDAARSLFNATGAGVMLVDDGSMLRAVAATDARGYMLESRQEDTGEGPCVDALVTDRIVLCADLASDPRWPRLQPDLPDSGVRAVLGVPVHAANVTVGSLNVYRDAPHDWGETEIEALETYALLIERLLVNALQAEHLSQLAEQLQHALDNRVVIERAVGLIMGREEVDAVTAFDRLRRMARSSERRAAEVAAEILEGRRDPRGVALR
ncbi:MAG: GAF and ANTAR domain-containing protein [Solirubrobacterales bacterium]|nr:GAF and ANTAR domain-containing protein [Solirubrobacterales bacterium]